MSINKTLILLAVFIGILLCSVGYSDARHRTAVGKKAPAISLTHNNKTISLDDFRGEYVMLTFWSATDAPSRRAVNVYTAWKRSHPTLGFNVIGINFDDSRTLFDEIVRRDRLNSSNQYYLSGDDARAIGDSYGLDGGFGSVLVGPDGKIVALNPSEQALSAIVSTQGPRRSISKALS